MMQNSQIKLPLTVYDKKNSITLLNPEISTERFENGLIRFTFIKQNIYLNPSLPCTDRFSCYANFDKIFILE